MCDPVTIMAGAALATDVTGSIIQAKQQNKHSKQVAQAADSGAQQQIRQLDVRASQEQDATAQGILGADRQARFADAQARVSAGEAGVAGASVDAQLTDISRQDAEYHTAASTNLQNTLDQINEEKAGVRANAANIKAGAPPSNPWATGVQIAGAALNFGSQILIRHTKANKT